MARTKQNLQPNLIDKVVAYFDPVQGMRRMKARGMMALAGGYFGSGKKSRPGLGGWNPGAADADGDIVPDLVDLRSLSRDLARTSALAGGAINTVVTNVVGTGLSLDPQPDAHYLGLNDEQLERWQATVLREWKLFAESPDFFCDITRYQNFYGLQSLAFRSALESGDCFAILPKAELAGSPFSFAIQLIEADRVCNPNSKQDTQTLVQGIELNTAGAPIRCHICDTHPGNRRLAKSATWTAIPFFGEKTGRRNILHLIDRKRPGQTRGVPYLASVIEPLKQLSRYSEAEISAAVVSAAFAVFVKMDPTAFDDLFDDAAKGNIVSAAKQWDGTMPMADVNAPGRVVNLLPGEEVTSPDLKRPNVAFDPFVQAVLRQIGVNLELPFEILIKHFTSSYSAARAALLDAWRFFRGRREWLIAYFCQPVYEQFLADMVAGGRINAPGFFSDPVIRAAWCNAVWIGDGPGSLDPLKEADAAEKRLELGTSTLSSESILHDGVPWTVKHQQRVREVTARRRDGLEEGAAPVTAANAPPAPKKYPSDDE